MKTSCSTLKRLTVAVIAYSCCVLSSIDARSFFFLTPRTEKCALMPVVSETNLHLQYYSPDLEPKQSPKHHPHEDRHEHRHHNHHHLSTIAIYVNEHVVSPDPVTPPRILSSNKITSGEGKINVSIDFNGKVQICFSSPDPSPHLVGYSVTHSSSHDDGKTKVEPLPPPKDNTDIMRRELGLIQGGLVHNTDLILELMETAEGLENQEHLVWEALDAAYSKLSWNPFLKIPIILAMAWFQATVIISHLKKKFII